jgi:hypothetical protein
MRIKSISRPFLVAAVIVGVLAVGCTGNDSGETTTTASPTTDLTTEQQEFLTAFEDAAPGDHDGSHVLAAGEAMCVNLELLQAAGTPPGYAADAFDLVVLDGASVTEKSEFGLILALAPTTLCDEVARYGEAVSYWLGF